ncbi:MAG: amidohydrolase family protein [Dehalococcoidales bacterium]|nr:amidohydrolase family protein [Dehalococcoidales bacterium]
MQLNELENEFALVGSTLIDGSGAEVKQDAVVAVKDGVIKHVGGRDSVQLDQGVQQVDVSGKFIMPGLINCHVHFLGCVSEYYVEWMTEPNEIQAIRTVNEARKMLEWGFTTVRDCGSRYSLALKRAIDEGSAIGPRIVSSGLGISRTGGHGDLPRNIWALDDEFIDHVHPWALRANGTDDIRKKVRRLISQGVDMIKFWATGGGYWEKDNYKHLHFTLDEMQVICDEAHELDLRVGVHSKNFRSHKRVIEAGVDVIDHFYFCEGEEVDDEIIEKMLDNNIAFVPMCSIYLVEIEKGVGEWAVPKIPENNIRSWQRAYRNGVKLAMGTDSFTEGITPRGSYDIKELKRMVDILGLTPMESIVASTKVAAEACGIQDSVGTIEKGKLADLLILRENPIDNIGSLEKMDNILNVVKGGKLVR